MKWDIGSLGNKTSKSNCSSFGRIWINQSICFKTSNCWPLHLCLLSSGSKHNLVFGLNQSCFISFFCWWWSEDLLKLTHASTMIEIENKEEGWNELFLFYRRHRSCQLWDGNSTYPQYPQPEVFLVEEFQSLYYFGAQSHFLQLNLLNSFSWPYILHQMLSATWYGMDV